MKRKNVNSYTVKGSGFSAFSIIGFLCFFLIIPFILVLVAKDMVDVSGLVSDSTAQSLPSICYGIAAIIAIPTLIIVIIKICIAKKTSYTFENNVLIIRKATVFTQREETRKVFYSPGMAVHSAQTIKGAFFNYGTVTISLGLGNAGEIVMKNVRRPNKAKKVLTKMIAEQSYAGYPHNSNIPNMANSPYAYGMGLGYPFFGGFGGFGYQPYTFGNGIDCSNCPYAPKNR